MDEWCEYRATELGQEETGDNVVTAPGCPFFVEPWRTPNGPNPIAPDSRWTGEICQVDGSIEAARAHGWFDVLGIGDFPFVDDEVPAEPCLDLDNLVPVTLRRWAVSYTTGAAYDWSVHATGVDSLEDEEGNVQTIMVTSEVPMVDCGGTHDAELSNFGEPVFDPIARNIRCMADISSQE